MKKYFGLGLAFTLALSSVPTYAGQNFTVDDYNKSLIKNGVAWDSRQGTYLPSFYTGFAPRIEEANRIHLHLSRGNQIRLTTQLDEYSVLTYLYGLKKRAQLFDQSIQLGLIKLQQQDQVSLFKATLNSSAYSIDELIQKLESKQISKEQFYASSLQVLEQLNKGRVFHIKLNLSANIERWKKTVDAFLAASSGSIETAVSANQQKTIVLLNDLLWGRVNLTYVSNEIKTKLIETLKTQSDSVAFEKNSLELLQLITSGRYSFNVLRNGKLQSSIYTENGQTILEYPEFTAIYPNGSVKEYVKDRDGNQIPYLREQGALKFLSRDYHDVDHIRSEPFYGFIPKLDYSSIGNGLHNPAVRTNLKNKVYTNLHNDLNIPENDDTLWIVSRGGVSHGCTRMAAGHILEVRQIIPTENKRMTEVAYFGNNSADYDLYDIDGNGSIEVMGVQYFLAYAIAADSGEGYREGAGLIPESQKRDAFYNFLYGQKNQFRVVDGSYKFINPYISQFAYNNPTDERGKAFSVKMNGEYSLYEQKYEQDKMQFFKMESSMMGSLATANNNASLGKQIVRLMGRATGCGIFKKEYALCSEDTFDKEFSTLATKAKKVK